MSVTKYRTRPSAMCFAGMASHRLRNGARQRRGWTFIAAPYGGSDGHATFHRPGGASILFFLINNGLPVARVEAHIVRAARETDKARPIENRLWVVRADVAGISGDLISLGPQQSLIQTAM